MSLSKTFARTCIDEGILYYLVEELISPSTPMSGDDRTLTAILASTKKNKYVGKVVFASTIYCLVDSAGGNGTRLRWWFEQYDLFKKLVEFVDKSGHEDLSTQSYLLGTFYALGSIGESIIDGSMANQVDLLGTLMKILKEAKEGKRTWNASVQAVYPFMWVRFFF